MNGYGRTQLSGVVSILREEIVKMLRERVDFEPNAREVNSSTPLSQATWDGGEGLWWAARANVSRCQPSHGSYMWSNSPKHYSR